MITIRRAEDSDAVCEVLLLFREYASSLTVDLAFQNFERELATLPGEYAAPHKRLFVASVHDGEAPNKGGSVPHTRAPDVAAGCVALRKLEGDICEMKRLYVRKPYRGIGIGRSLANAAFQAAREAGYRRMRLDPLPEMMQAQKLYRAFGFREIPAYRYNPVVGTKFFELML